jgi:hypothetical protein
MQVSTGVPAARKRGGRRHTKGTCWGRVASEPSAWAADPPSWSEALEIDEARAPWPRQAGRSHRLWRCGSRCQATETTGHRPSRASDVHLRDARKQRESSIGQRGPTPQLQRVVEQAPRRRRIAPDARRARLTDERLETARVDCVGLYRQPISRRHRLQYRTGVTERAPRRDAVTRSLRIASAGAARGHSASATDSADTGCGARTVNKVNSARCLPAGTQTRAPFTCASSDPRIAICSTIATANTTPAHTRCERHARATQLRAAMVPSVQATTPTRRRQCRSTAPPSTPPGPRIGRGEAGRGARARSGRAGGDLPARGRLPVETRFVVPRHPTGSRVAALVRELAAFMFLADGVRNELLGRDARLSGGARLQAWSGRRVG